MILETNRLVLREYTHADFQDLLEILSDPETMQHYPSPYDADGTRRWINWSIRNYETYGFGLWAIVLKNTGAFIGDCGITMQNIDGKLLPEIGYHINKRYWRQGYAREAASAVRDWAFTHTGYDCLYSYMHASNIASCSTACSIGMRKIKEYTDPRDGLLYVCSMTREEWESIQR